MHASWLRVTVRMPSQPLVCMLARGISVFFFLIMAGFNGSLAELIESIEWDGKDSGFVDGIMSIFTLNDITVRACWFHLGLPDHCFFDSFIPQVIGHLSHATVDSFIWPTQTSGGKKAFVSKVLSAFRKTHGVGDVSSGSTSSSDDSGLQAALLTVLGVKQTKELVHVDMSEKMAEHGLLKHFPAEVWPQPHAVRELATKIKARVKLGEAKPFIFAELRKCVLSFRFQSMDYFVRRLLQVRADILSGVHRRFFGNGRKRKKGVWQTVGANCLASRMGRICLGGCRDWAGRNCIVSIHFCVFS